MSTNTPNPPLLPATILPPYRTSHSRLLIFDYDGTLTPIVPNPPSALLSPETITHLTNLSTNPKNELWIISGRDRLFLSDQVASKLPSSVGLSAEHGAFIRMPGNAHWDDLRGGSDGEKWRAHVTECFERLVEEIPGSEIESKEAAVAWHFRRAEVGEARVVGRAKAVVKELRGAVERNGWRAVVMEGKCVVEVRTDRLNKGAIVAGIVTDKAKNWDFVACFGDDVTDEDMFKAVNLAEVRKERVFSVKIGDGRVPTSAFWCLADPIEVCQCISWLTDADRG